MSRFSAMRSEWTSKSLELPKETSSSPPRAGELGPGTEPCRTRQAPLRCPQSLVGVSHCCCEVGPHGGWKMDKMTSKGPRVMWLPWWGQTGVDPRALCTPALRLLCQVRTGPYPAGNPPGALQPRLAQAGARGRG